MRKWIRWWGIIAFIVIVLIATGSWFLFADKIVERNIEKTGEYLVGAKVDIQKADLSIIPLGITLENITVANPNAPTHNLIDAENIQFHLDGKYLFERKVIIQDMVVDGLKFNTERSESGEIKGAEPMSVSRAYDEFVMPLLDLSKLKTFIEQEDLKSINNLKAVINDFERVNKEWQAAVKSMPTVDDVKKYRTRSEKIYSDIEKNSVTGLLANAKNINDLKEDIERDINVINLNKKAMLVDIDSLQTKKDRAIASIEKDYIKLTEKYTPNIRGLKNFSKYIFKDDIIQQIDKGLSWYNNFSPLFNYAYNKIKENHYSSTPLTFDGIDIHYSEHDPKPNFLIDLAKLSFVKSKKDIDGEIKNFTFQQNITGLPTQISFNSYDLEFANSLRFKASIDHTNQNYIKDDLFIDIGKGKIKESSINILDNWQLSISNGFVDKEFDIKIHDGKIIGGADLDFSNISFISKYSGDENVIIQTIGSVLQDVSNFAVNVKIDGSPGDYQTIISSDIDNIIDRAVTNIALRESEKVKETIQSHFDKQKNELLKTYDIMLAVLQDQFTQTQKLENEIKTIMKKLP